MEIVTLLSSPVMDPPLLPKHTLEYNPETEGKGFGVHI